MPGAFLHKKSLLDQFKDDYKMVNPIKARHTERQWENPIVRRKREKGVQDWAKSFAGKRHYRKLARFNAMRSEAYTEKTAWTYLEELGKLEGEESRMDVAEKILKALGCKPGTEGRWYGKDGDEVDIIDVLDNTEWAFAQKVCGQLQEAKQAKRIYPKFVQINTQRDFDKYIKPALGKGASAYGLSDIEGMWWEIAEDERVPASAKTVREIRDSVSKRPRFIFISGAGFERGIVDLSLTEYAEEMGMTVKNYLDGYDAGSWESKKSETLSYEKGNKNSRGEDAPWVIRDHKGGKVLASFAKKADAEAHLERMQRYSKSESATSDRAAAIKDAIAGAARTTGLANKIVLSATNMPKLFVDVYQGGIMGDGINWEVTGNLDVRRFDKQDVKRAWRVDSLEELEKSFEDEFWQLKDGKFESLKKVLHESRVKKLEAFGRSYREDVILQILDQDNSTYSKEDLEGKTVAELEEIYSELVNLADAAKHEAAEAITSREVQAAAHSAWSTSGATGFKLDIVRLGDRIIIYAKGPNGEDDIGISWHVHIPGGTNSYKTPHVEQFADWGSDKHEPERTYDAKDLDDLEDFLLDEFKALQETLDVSKAN